MSILRPGWTRRGPSLHSAFVRRGVTILLLGLLASLAGTAAPASAGGPLRTAIVDPGNFGVSDPTTAFLRARQTGATMVRLLVSWRDVAPVDRPVGFDPTNPADPAYTWTAIDRQVTGAVSAGLQPILVLQIAPDWASVPASAAPGRTRWTRPSSPSSPRAVAGRYNGDFSPGPDYAEFLPHVIYYQAWNEPNRDYFWRPQYTSGKIVSAGAYRTLVTQMTDAVHGVNPANRSIAGGLAPLGRPGKPAPMAFMKAFLAARVSFDIWSHHPYTSGGPLHKSPGGGDITLGSLSTMRSYLTSMKRKGRIASSSSTVPFWVTEFSWDSKPPDPAAIPTALHQRWVSEALYRMWKNGVSVVTWFRIADDPLSFSPYQSGFFTFGGKRKPSLEAFRFPVVALRQRRGILVWGRTPTSKGAKVIVEIKTGTRWRRLGSTLSANKYGIFTRTYRVPYTKGYVRARAVGETSIPFSLKYVKDRYVNPFGCGGAIGC